MVLGFGEGKREEGKIIRRENGESLIIFFCLVEKWRESQKEIELVGLVRENYSYYLIERFQFHGVVLEITSIIELSVEYIFLNMYMHQQKLLEANIFIYLFIFVL